MSIDSSSAFFARLSFRAKHCIPCSAKPALSAALIYKSPAIKVCAAPHAAAEITKPAQPSQCDMAYKTRLAGKKVAIFIDYQFEDLEVTFPMLRSVHKSSASPPPLQLTG